MNDLEKQIAVGRKLKEFLDQGKEGQEFIDSIYLGHLCSLAKDVPGVIDILDYYVYNIHPDLDNLPPKQEIVKVVDDMIAGKDLTHVVRRWFAERLLEKLEMEKETGPTDGWTGRIAERVSINFGQYFWHTTCHDEPLSKIFDAFEEIYGEINYPFDYDIPMEKIQGMCQALLVGEDPGGEWWRVPEDLQAKMVRVLGGFSVK